LLAFCKGVANRLGNFGNPIFEGVSRERFPRSGFRGRSRDGLTRFGVAAAEAGPDLDFYHAGYLREARCLWQAMEDRDLLIRNVASKRKKAVSRAQWEILTVDNSPEAMAQKEALEVFYNNLVATSVLNENERGGIGFVGADDDVGDGDALRGVRDRLETD
jgi:hypothetical protein